MRLTRLELAIMDVIWRLGAVSIREVQDGLPRGRHPAYTTVQTVVYRLEAKGAVRRAKKIGNANIFEPIVSRSAAHTKLLDDLLRAFGGGAQPLMAHLVETGQITRADLDDARRRLEELEMLSKSKGKPR